MKIKIERLSIPMSLGMFHWEQKSQRTVIFTLVAEFDGTRASASDNINDTVDYAVLEQHIIRIAQAQHYDLLESLVSIVGRELLAHYPLLQEITIEAAKPGALRQAEGVSIQETFRRG